MTPRHVAQQKSLPRRCRRQKLSAVGEHHRHVLLAALEDGVNQRRQRDPTEQVDREVGEDQDLENARQAGEDPGSRADTSHVASVTKRNDTSVARRLRVGYRNNFIPAWPAESSAKGFPFIGVQMRLAQNAAECSDWDFGPPRHNRRVDHLSNSSHKFDVTALLTGFNETSRLQSPLDFAERKRPKPPQPRPRWFESLAAESRSVARSKAPRLPLSYPATLPRFHPG